MQFLSQISFDEIAISLAICVLIRELSIAFLPDHIAGPGGWLVDTGEDK